MAELLILRHLAAVVDSWPTLPVLSNKPPAAAMSVSESRPPPSFFAEHGGRLGRGFRSAKLVFVDPDEALQRLRREVSFVLPPLPRDCAAAYFFPCDADGVLSAECSTVPIAELRVLEPAACHASLPLVFLAVHRGLLGRAFLTQGGLYAEPYVGEDVYLPTKAGNEAYFVPSKALHSPDEFSEESVLVVPVSELLVPIDQDNSAAGGQLCEPISNGPAIATEKKVPRSGGVAENPNDTAPQAPSGTATRQNKRSRVATVTPQELSHDCSEELPRGMAEGGESRQARTSRSSVRLPQGGDGEWSSQEDRELFRTHWPHLRRNLGWRVEWSAFGTDELYVVPGGSTRDARLEGVQYFTHRDGFIRHLSLNPCLGYSWPELKAALKSQRWDFSAEEGRFRCAYPVGTADHSVDGLHVFRSRLAVTTFVHRFPYPLQDDEALSALLARIGWKGTTSKKKGKLWQAPEGGEAYSLNAARRQFWLRPSLLLRYLCAAVDGMDVMSDEHLTDTVQVDVQRSKDSDEASDGEGESSREVQLIERFVSNAAAESFDEHHFRRLMQGLDWRWESAIFSNEWWRHEIVFIAPWANTAKPKSVKAGLDFFFCVKDVFAYVRDRGHSDKLRRPIELELDLRQPEHNLNRRIHELAKRSQPLSHNLFNMLYSSGWELRKLKCPLLSHASVKEVYLPYWSRDKFDEDLLGSLTAGEDFFVYKEDVVEYLRTHGNLQGDCLTGDSPRSQTRRKRERDAMPETPNSKLEYLIARSKNLYRADTDIWALLRDSLGWRCVATQGRKHRESCVYLPPWGKEVFEAGGKSEPDMMVLHRDYFYDTQSLLKYLVKYGNQPTNAPVTPEESSWRTCRSSKLEIADRTADETSPVVRARPQSLRDGGNKQPSPAAKRGASAAKKRKVAKKVMSASLVDRQVRHLILALLKLRRDDDDCDLRLLKFVYNASLAYGLHWFHSARCGLTIKIYTFIDKRLLGGPKQLSAFVEGRDFWVEEESFMEYMHRQLRVLGYDSSDNSIDPAVEVVVNEDEEQEDDHPAESGYSLNPLGNLLPLSSGTEDPIARFAPSEGPASAAASPYVGSAQGKHSDQGISQVSSALASRSSNRKADPGQSSSKKRRTSPLSQRLDECRHALLPSARGQALVGREEQLTTVLGYLESAAGGNTRRGLYLCGMSGVGKTATAEQAIEAFRAAREGAEAEGMVFARFTGTGLSFPFSFFAESLGLSDGASAGNEQAAEQLCLRHFSPSPAQLHRKDYPRYVLLIDEIDKMPRAAVKQLYLSCISSTSRLCVIGIANDISIPDFLKLREEASPEIIVFPSPDKAQLRAILASRTYGVFSDKAVEVLVMKAYQRGGDVRLLLDLALGSLEYAIGNSTVALDEKISHLVEYGDVLKHCNTVGLGSFPT